MCKDKKMFALIITIMVMVLFITGWVFADHSVMDLISATPILEMKNAISGSSAPLDPPALNLTNGDSGMCTISGSCD